MKKRIVVLGSTGSIGTQALNVIEAEQYELLALSCNSSTELLAAQVQRHRPRFVGISDEHTGYVAPKGVELVTGKNASSILAALEDADIVLIGISGFAGLKPLLSALEKGKSVALANKESIVCAHSLVKRSLIEHGGKIIPVDSEHCAIAQCMQNGSHSEVERLILTASGGPFRGYSEERLENVSVEQALSHPTWNMGKKITIDSATLFNKGLELIEASHLFDIPENKISVLIHPQSIVHSMVEYCDGAVIAQLSKPDMRMAIQYALSYPDRHHRVIDRLDLVKAKELTFFDGDSVDAIRLAREALRGGEYLPIVYNAANEAAVELFLSGRISFNTIRRVVENCMLSVSPTETDTLEDIERVDKQTREFAIKGEQKWRY